MVVRDLGVWLLWESEKMVEAKRVTICVGDIHGHLHRLRNLWRNLELKLGSEAFRNATVIFLGDYNDRGADTKGVLDFLVSLPQRYPQQRHVFLAGNHDFAFAAFLGVLPTPPSPGILFSTTWEEFQHNEEREGWWTGPGQEDIHLQVNNNSHPFSLFLPGILISNIKEPLVAWQFSRQFSV